MRTRTEAQGKGDRANQKRANQTLFLCVHGLLFSLLRQQAQLLRGAQLPANSVAFPIQIFRPHHQLPRHRPIRATLSIILLAARPARDDDNSLFICTGPHTPAFCIHPLRPVAFTSRSITFPVTSRAHDASLVAAFTGRRGCHLLTAIKLLLDPWTFASVISIWSVLQL